LRHGQHHIHNDREQHLSIASVTGKRVMVIVWHGISVDHFVFVGTAFAVPRLTIRRAA
jgi:hypothetical protein